MTPTVIVEKGKAIAPSGSCYKFECIGGTDFQVYSPGSREVAGKVGKGFIGSRTPTWMIKPTGAGAWLKVSYVHKWQDAIAELVILLENTWRENPPLAERAASVNGKSIE